MSLPFDRIDHSFLLETLFFLDSRLPHASAFLPLSLAIYPPPFLYLNKRKPNKSLIMYMHGRDPGKLSNVRGGTLNTLSVWDVRGEESNSLT